jgi:hypothetical protein
MMIIGVDYHPSFQTIAFLMEETGECGEQELNHSDGQAERFYRDLQQRGIRVRVGMEATGYSRWFERLLAELGFEVWMGDPAEIKAKRVKKQKFDREDARLDRTMVGTSPTTLLARVRNRWRRHHNRMNLQRRRTPRASQHEMGLKAPRTVPLLPVAGDISLLTFPFYRTR